MQSKNKKRIFLSPPDMGGQEMDFVKQAFDSNYIAPLGPMVDAFEKEFAEKTGVGHAVALTSGTAAMHLALKNLGVGPGDEVLASTLTFIGSVSPIVFEGARPVFVDSDRETWNMDPDLLEQELNACRRLGKVPKAVVPTDLYGQCADYGRIFDVCEKYGVPVVVDAAEALGACYYWERGNRREERGNRNNEGIGKQFKNKNSKLKIAHHAGWGAKVAVYSFNGNKIITTSGGGMLASDDREFIEKARFLSQQARDPAVHYEHSEIGYNYRMSNILAAIGIGQLRVLEARVQRKQEIFEYYTGALEDLPGLEFMPEAPYGQCSRWLTVVLITPEAFGADREAVRLALEGENIESRPMWKPMHLQPVFRIRKEETEKRIEKKDKSDSRKQYPARVVGGEVSEDLFDRGLCLPSGTAMTEADLERVVGAIRKCRR